jgi:hypothetical protein
MSEAVSALLLIIGHVALVAAIFGYGTLIGAHLVRTGQWPR